MLIEFREYVKKNYKTAVMAFVFSCVCFFVMLTHYMVLIDEEVHLTESTVDPVLFLFGSRYTNYLLAKLFWNGRIIPFFSDFLALIIWNVSSFLFGSIFFRDEHTPFARFVSFAYFTTVPFCVGEMFAFSQVILETSLGMAFTALAFILTVFEEISVGSLKHRIIFRISVIILLTLAFGSYQAFVCVYATATAGFCLTRHWEGKPFIKILISAFTLCLISVLCYLMVNQLIFRMIIARVIANTTYLSDNYIGWRSEGIVKAAFMAFANVIRVSFAIPVRGVRVYGGVPIFLLTSLFVLMAAYKTVMEKERKERIKTLLLSLFVLLAPFCLYLALGTYKTPGRMMLALSLSGMIEILLLFRYTHSYGLKKVLSGLIAVALILNAVNMNMIYYSAYRGYLEDARLADEIIEDICELTDETINKRIVFIGAHERTVDISPVDATLGASFFEWDGGVNYRLRAFLELRGCTFLEASFMDIEKGLSLSEGMNPWPEDDSIRIEDDMVVVFFNEPTSEWYAANLYR